MTFPDFFLVIYQKKICSECRQNVGMSVCQTVIFQQRFQNSKFSEYHQTVIHSQNSRAAKEPNLVTFVHQKTEIYNSYAMLDIK